MRPRFSANVISSSKKTEVRVVFLDKERVGPKSIRRRRDRDEVFRRRKPAGVFAEEQAPLLAREQVGFQFAQESVQVGDDSPRIGFDRRGVGDR